MQDELPPLNGLRSFVAAAQELSFSRAARQLGVTPGAVSRLVRKLEEHLGVRLVERTAHGLRLTDRGTAYFRDVAGPLAAVGTATRRLARTRNPNRIVVACYPTFAARWLLPRWSRFFDRHPEVDVQLMTSLNDVDFERDAEVDVAICLGADTEIKTDVPGLVREKLLDIEISAVCTPRLFAGCRSEVQRLERLAKLVRVHTRPLPDEWRHWLDEYAAHNKGRMTAQILATIDPRPGPVFETLNLGFQAASEGIGVAVGIDAFVRDEVASGLLVRPFAFRRRSQRHFHLVARTGGANARAVGLYRRWLIGEARTA